MNKDEAEDEGYFEHGDLEKNPLHHIKIDLNLTEATYRDVTKSPLPSSESCSDWYLTVLHTL